MRAPFQSSEQAKARASGWIQKAESENEKVEIVMDFDSLFEMDYEFDYPYPWLALNDIREIRNEGQVDISRFALRAR
jgi:hypothetical protein